MRAPYMWYPVFLREMLLFRRKLLRAGYLFSAMVVPVIYLVTFGLGLGRNVTIHGTDYLTFLVLGLVAMSSMNNSYSWVASALTLNRLYFKTFQIFVQAPIRPVSLMTGEVLAGMVKGLFASSLIAAVGYVTSPSFSLSALVVFTVFLNCFVFASLGVISGMLAKSHEDTATYQNFFILPMAFFSGTFFPVDNLPGFLKFLVHIMPLTHTNVLVRKTALDGEAFTSMIVLAAFGAVFFCCGTILISRYRE
ncbi:MAG TPA: ABC transporter permease [Dissulfurispiraceae bacterium]|nr:ABC transporter permease [Dissulfurispiraceae bacterium]